MFGTASFMRRRCPIPTLKYLTLPNLLKRKFALLIAEIAWARCCRSVTPDEHGAHGWSVTGVHAFR